MPQNLDATRQCRVGSALVFRCAPGEPNARGCKTGALAGRVETYCTGTAFDHLETLRTICAFRRSLFVVARHDDKRCWPCISAPFRRFSPGRRFQSGAALLGVGERMYATVARRHLPFQNRCISPSAGKRDARRRCVAADEQESWPCTRVEVKPRTRRHHEFVLPGGVFLSSLAWMTMIRARVAGGK